MCGVGVMCKCWFRALHLFLYSLAVYSPLSDSSDAALSPLVYRAPSRACARTAETRRSSRANAARPPRAVRVWAPVRCGSVARCVVCVGACVCVETKLKL